MITKSTPSYKFAPNTPKWAYNFLIQASQKYKIPTSVLSALIGQESSWNQNAISSAGAKGLGQFMPSTAKALGIDPMNVEQAIMGAGQYLRQQMDAFGGDLEKGLAAYNAGAGAVKLYNGIPPFAETKNYVKSITSVAKSVDSDYAKAAQSVTPPQGDQYGGINTASMSNPQKALLRNLFQLKGGQQEATSVEDPKYEGTMTALDTMQKKLDPYYQDAMRVTNLIDRYVASRGAHPSQQAQPGQNQYAAGIRQQQGQPVQPQQPQGRTISMQIPREQPPVSSYDATQQNYQDPAQKKKRVPSPHAFYLGSVLPS